MRPGIEPTSLWILAGFFFFFFLSFVFFVVVVVAISWAAPAAYGGSQARGQIELQLPVYATAMIMWDPSHICNLHHSLQQRQILNPLGEAKYLTRVLVDASQVR